MTRERDLQITYCKKATDCKGCDLFVRMLNETPEGKQSKDWRWPEEHVIFANTRVCIKEPNETIPLAICDTCIDNSNHEAEIGIITDPKHHREHLARSLINSMEKWLKQMKIRKVVALIDNSNFASENLFGKLNYTPDISSSLGERFTRYIHEI